MSLILNIDTATENAHVSFAKDGQLLKALGSESQKEHASFLHTAIQQLSKTIGISLKDVDAVAVTAGPGSYTGLRVGMASAKGLCYALKKPLITISSLEILTLSAVQLFPDSVEAMLFCPMIDARRLEVFTAVYKKDLTLYLPPCAMILDEFSFENELSKDKIMFFGSGAPKWKMICPASFRGTNAVFETVSILPESMSNQSNNLFLQKKFTILAYSEPLYLKEFQTVTKQ